ncbi:MAG: hypothetical protein LBE61_05970 [Burkholderiaceae bacterium]|jgi:hypothetical protein|nr:hypothetical protein [Burkholderiaceae bacterium]
MMDGACRQEATMETDEHPIVAMFRKRAEVLETRHAQRDPNEAISRLAIWISLNIDKLSSEDINELTDIGGLLLREQIRRSMIWRVK